MVVPGKSRFIVGKKFVDVVLHEFLAELVFVLELGRGGSGLFFVIDKIQLLLKHQFLQRGQLKLVYFLLQLVLEIARILCVGVYDFDEGDFAVLWFFIEERRYGHYECICVEYLWDCDRGRDHICE